MNSKKVLIVGDDEEQIREDLKPMNLDGDLDIEIIQDNSVSRQVNKLTSVIAAAAMISGDMEMYDYFHDDPYYKVEKRGKYGPVRDSSKEPKIQRNDICPCDNGKKYKKCCINKINENERS